MQNLRAAIGTFGFNLPRFARADSVGAGGFFGKRGRVFYGLRAAAHVRVGVEDGHVDRFAEIRRNGADEPRGVRQQKRVFDFLCAGLNGGKRFLHACNECFRAHVCGVVRLLHGGGKILRLHAVKVRIENVVHRNLGGGKQAFGIAFKCIVLVREVF